MSVTADRSAHFVAIARAAVCVLALMSAFTAAAEDRLLTGALGRWLQHSATPELVDVLGKHPMFKGETIRIVSMRDGKPQVSSDELTVTVQEYLTRRLVQAEGVRIAWGDRMSVCAVPRDINYLLGVEVKRIGDGEHRLNLAMVDVQEAVWVNGVNLTWSGKLTGSERRALARVESRAQRGSLENPLDIGSIIEVSDALRERLRCSLPDGLDGPVYFQSPEQTTLSRISKGIEHSLAVTPLASFTQRRDTAEWTMALSTQHLGDATHELVLTVEQTDGTRPQRVASLFVTGVGNTAVAEKPQPEPHRAPSVPVDRSLLSEVRHVGDCERRGGKRCVEVELDLQSDAYLLVFHTRGGELGTSQCDARLDKEKSGAHRYKVRLDSAYSGSERPDFGFYAVAIKNRTVARTFQKWLLAVPGACGNPARQNGAWHAARLADLDRLMRANGDTMDWRGLHLVRVPNGFSSL